MSLVPSRLLREIRKVFQSTQTTMTALHSAVQVRPSGSEEAIQLTGNSSDRADFECRPVVCCVPQRAGALTAEVYIVFQGLLSIRENATTGEAVTSSYSTNFGYFVTAEKEITHALGGHYDFVEADICHPRSHLQLRSQADLWDHVVERFPSLSGVAVARDPMREVLNRVRAPCAQMDFLSFMVQVAADHLVDSKSPNSVRSRFKSLTATCRPFAGYAVTPGHADWECHRAAHWYPQ